jgi:L-fuculose-phosphate aldolase
MKARQFGQNRLESTFSFYWRRMFRLIATIGRRMYTQESELRQEIVAIGKLMYEKGWVAANDGNISVRLDSSRVLCTPTRVSKGMMTPADMIVVDLSGRKLAGERECTSEIAMHLTIYSLRPDVISVVHAHPPVATGFAVAGRALDQALLPEVVVSLGSIPLAPYGLPGTPALSQAILPYVSGYDALLLANHGAVAYGPSLREAFFKLETLEHFARIALIAEMLGGAKVLPRRDVEKLFDSRGRYGVSSPTVMAPGAPVVAEDLHGYSNGKIEVSREELAGLIDEALRLRGVVTRG